MKNKKYRCFLEIAAVIALSAICTLGVSAESGEAAVTSDTVSVQTTVLSEAELQTTTIQTDVIQTTTEATQTTVDTAQTTDITTTEAESAVGWIEQNGKRYYLSENGEFLTGYQKIDDKEYYFAANGVLKSGWYTIKDARMYFSPETFERQLGWVNYNGNDFYLDENGKKTGFCEIDENQYIFDSYGICCTGWFEYEGHKYYSDSENGIYIGEKEIDGVKYLFSSKGKFRSGWQTVDGIRVFYDYDSNTLLYGLIYHNGNIYYSSEEKGKSTGECDIEGRLYKFDNNGCMQLGFQKFADGVRYYDENGNIAEGFVTVDGKKYYFNSRNLMQTGLQSIDGKKYYFDDNGIMQTGFQTIDGKKYYFDKNGVTQTGLQTIGGKKYYFDKNGVMQTGFQTIDGKMYYFDSNGIMQTDTFIDNYQIDSEGVAKPLSEVQTKAAKLLKTIGTTTDEIFNYCNTHNIYRYMEPTKSLDQLNSIGWSYFANYAMDNYFVVCYYFAALQDILFDMAGYESRVIYGTQGSGDHYWNQVKINGEWRNFDACMGHNNLSDDALSKKGFVWYEYVYPTYN